MSRHRPQTCVIAIEFPDGQNFKREVAGLNTGNIRSKLKSYLDDILIGYATAYGATITITIERAEPDEFTRPDPE